MKRRGSSKKVQEILTDQDGVEVALTRSEAVRQFLLPADRIGDLLVLAQEDAVFSPVDDGLYQDVDVRSHGSYIGEMLHHSESGARDNNGNIQ